MKSEPDQMRRLPVTVATMLKGWYTQAMPLAEVSVPLLVTATIKAWEEATVLIAPPPGMVRLVHLTPSGEVSTSPVPPNPIEPTATHCEPV